jgi:hypothetical protein
VSKKRSRARLGGVLRVARDERDLARIMTREVLDDDGGLGDRAITRVVAENREAAEGPKLGERGAMCGVAEIDELGLERGVVLVKSDEHLLTERGKRMKIEGERHAGRSVPQDVDKDAPPHTRPRAPGST